MTTHRRVAFLFALSACSAQPAPKEPAPPIITPMPVAQPEDLRPEESPATEPKKRAPAPVGPASFSIHVPIGRRQPIVLDGRIQALLPPRGSSGLDAWTQLDIAAVGPKTELYLLIEPASVTLPFTAGDRVHVEVDCRKGGWHRVCDGKIVDATRRVLAMISGSGDEEVAKGWSIERGSVATSEIHPGPTRVVEHTHALTFSSERASVTALPHQWARVLVHGRSYLVQGHETVWEGPPPPDARDHREFAILLER